MQGDAEQAQEKVHAWCAHMRLKGMPANMRCIGITRAGKQCSITGDSTFAVDRGRLVGAPSRRGCAYCLFHALPLRTSPMEVELGECMVIFVDPETTGVSVYENSIVELAATQAPTNPRFHGASFSKRC